MLSPTLHSVIPSLTAAQVLGAVDASVIDLRSPREFGEDHLPGAHNVPLFDDVGRVLIGTLYRQTTPDSAFEAARDLARKRIPELVDQIGRIAQWQPRCDPGADFEGLSERGLAQLDQALVAQELAEAPARAVVLHCWRGGLRSRSVAALLRRLGLDRAVCLAQGYKGYRAFVLDEIARWSAPPSVVLRGLTGVGKTLVLRELERVLPESTIDLEQLAGHRSSVLGMVGLEPCTQKTFESRLALRLRQGTGPVTVFEGESRKVGNVLIPASVWNALQAGINFELVAPIERRVQVLMEDYLATRSSREQLREQLPFLEGRMGASDWSGKLTGLLDAGRERELTALLLEHYYDPLYRHSERGRDYALTIDASDPARAAQHVLRAIERMHPAGGRKIAGQPLSNVAGSV